MAARPTHTRSVGQIDSPMANYAASGAIIATAIRWSRKLASRKNHLMRDVVSREKKEKLHNAPNMSIQEPGIFVITGKIWKYQNKEAMDGTDRIGRNCKCCGNGNGYVVCLCFPALLRLSD